jgi:hypothetical protein
MIAIGVEPECRSVPRSISRWGSKGEPDALIAAESEITNLLMRLKLIRRSDLSMIAIGVETYYRFVAISLSKYGSKGEFNAPITIESEVTDFFEAIKTGLAIGLVHDSYQGRNRI